MASGATSVASSAAPESPVRLSAFAALSSGVRGGAAAASAGHAMLARGATARFREQADQRYGSHSSSSPAPAYHTTANPAEDLSGGKPPSKAKDSAATLSSLSVAAALADRRTPPAGDAPLRTVTSANGSTNGRDIQVNHRSSSAASSASRDRWGPSEGGPSDGAGSERDNGSERGAGGGSNHSDSGARDGGESPEDNESRITVNGQEIYADDLIGLRVAKAFEGHGRFLGQVVKFEEATQRYTVVYADGDAEEISIENTIEILIQPEIEQADPMIAPSSTMDSRPEAPEIHRVAPEDNVDLPPPSAPPQQHQQKLQQQHQPQQAYARPQTQSPPPPPPRRRTIQISEREAQFVIGLFENHALPALLRMGWRVEMSGSGIGKRFVAPPGGRRDRARIFSSVMDVVEFIALDEELLATCFPSSVHSAIVSLFPEHEQAPAEEFPKQVMQRPAGLEELDGRRPSRYDMQQPPRGPFMRSSAAMPMKRGYRLEETAGSKRAHDDSEAHDMSPTTQAKYSRYTYPSSSTQAGYLSSKDPSVVRRFHPDAYESHQRMASQPMNSKWSGSSPSDYRQSYAYSDRDVVAHDRSGVPGRSHISHSDGPPLYRHERAMTRPSARLEEVGAHPSHRYAEPMMSAAGLAGHEAGHFQPYQRRPRSPLGEPVHASRSAALYRTRSGESMEQDPRALAQGGGANRNFSMHDVDQTYSHPASSMPASSKPLMSHAMSQPGRREVGNSVVRDQPRYEDQRHYAAQRVDRHSFAPRSEMYRMQQHQQYAYDRRHPDSAHAGPPDHPRSSAERGRSSADGEHVI